MAFHRHVELFRFNTAVQTGCVTNVQYVRICVSVFVLATVCKFMQIGIAQLVCWLRFRRYFISVTAYETSVSPAPTTTTTASGTSTEGITQTSQTTTAGVLSTTPPKTTISTTTGISASTMTVVTGSAVLSTTPAALIGCVYFCDLVQEFCYRCSSIMAWCDYLVQTTKRWSIEI